VQEPVVNEPTTEVAASVESTDAVASEVKFVEGTHYTKLESPLASTGNVTVTEFFWYACPHCFHFESHIQGWVDHKPENVHFEQIPAVFSQRWLLLAKAHYVAKALKVEDMMSPILFREIHEKKRQVQTLPQLVTIFVENGVTEAEFMLEYEKLAEGGAHFADIERAIKLGQQFKLNGVPAVVVNGEYLVSNENAGSLENIIAITQFLVEKTQKASSK